VDKIAATKRDLHRHRGQFIATDFLVQQGEGEKKEKGKTLKEGNSEREGTKGVKKEKKNKASRTRNRMRNNVLIRKPKWNAWGAGKKKREQGPGKKVGKEHSPKGTKRHKDLVGRHTNSPDVPFIQRPKRTRGGKLKRNPGNVNDLKGGGVKEEEQ